jgi:hypothetical protein
MLQNDRAVLPEYIKQGKLLENPQYLCQFLQRDNLCDDLLCGEMKTWSGITSQQKPPLNSVLCGKCWIPRNYIKKIFTDYLLYPREFHEFYTPHVKRPLVNYLLRQNIVLYDVNNKPADVANFYYWGFAPHIDDNLRHILQIGVACGLGEIHLKYRFANKTLGAYVLCKQFGQFPEIDVRVNAAAALQILTNPPTKNGSEIFYCRFASPDCILEDTQYEKYIEVRV